MGLCCLFIKKKQYAYRVERSYSREYKLEKVVVTTCSKCDSVVIKNASVWSKEYQVMWVDSLGEVERFSKLNGIPLLCEVLNK